MSILMNLLCRRLAGAREVLWKHVLLRQISTIITKLWVTQEIYISAEVGIQIREHNSSVSNFLSPAVLWKPAY